MKRGSSLYCYYLVLALVLFKMVICMSFCFSAPTSSPNRLWSLGTFFAFTCELICGQRFASIKKASIIPYL